MKTRIAPTPSGYIHLGNVFSFALTAALAKKHNTSILLRIDDMDRERADEKYIRTIFEDLTFLGIPWNEGPRSAEEFQAAYSQVHRLPEYNVALDKLRTKGLVYACSCSRSQIIQHSPQGIYTGACRHKNIPLDSENVCWRLYTEPDVSIHVKNPDGTILRTTLPAEMQDFIVRRKDGIPAYQLSSVVDDVLFNVNLIVRGQDLWASTLAQLYLAQQLELKNFTETVFYHHSLLSDKDGRKLSKSAGDTSIQYLRQQGVSQAEIFRQIAEQLNLEGKAGSWEELILLYLI